MFFGSKAAHQITNGQDDVGACGEPEVLLRYEGGDAHNPLLTDDGDGGQKQ